MLAGLGDFPLYVPANTLPFRFHLLIFSQMGAFLVDYHHGGLAAIITAHYGC
jgi:hypothetical protein